MGLSGGVASLFTYPYVRDADWFAAGVPPYGNLYEYQRKQDTMTDLPQSLPQAWRPPMGWNSWDSYGTTLTEDELLANARFMAEHLKTPAGIRWSSTSTGTTRPPAHMVTTTTRR